MGKYNNKGEGDSMKIEFENVKNEFEEKANKIYHDNDKLKNLLVSVRDIVMENKQLSEIFDDIKTMANLLKDWVKGDYHELSKSSGIMIIIAFLYLINPLDLIPDFLFIGFIDDIAVIGFVYKKLIDEIDRYKDWKNISDTYQPDSQSVYSSDDFIEINLDEDIVQDK